MTFELRSERGEESGTLRWGRKGIPAGGHSTCKGPEVGKELGIFEERGWVCLRSIKEGAEAEAG